MLYSLGFNIYSKLLSILKKTDLYSYIGGSVKEVSSSAELEDELLLMMRE